MKLNKDRSLAYFPQVLEFAHVQSPFKFNSPNLKADNHLLLGILSIVISYVFKEGSRINEDQQLTV